MSLNPLVTSRPRTVVGGDPADAGRQAGNLGEPVRGAAAQVRPDKMSLTRALPSPMAMSNSNTELKHSLPQARRVDRCPCRRDCGQIKGAGKNRKLLLDLRDSSATMPAGIRLANSFSSRDLATLQGQKFPTQTFAADPAKFLTDAPVVVLVNRGTYGAAELRQRQFSDAKRGMWWASGRLARGRCRKRSSCPTAPHCC